MRILAVSAGEPFEPPFLAALRLARRFGATVVGAATVPTMETILMAPEMGVVLSDVHGRLVEAAEEQAHRARLAFEELARSSEAVREGGEAVGAEWLGGDRGPDIQSIGQLARVFDLSVVARPSTLSSNAGALLETVLFESGRPVLMVPSEVPAEIGRRVLVAWNRSSETARAVGLADHFLRRAEAVEVLSVEGGMVAGPDGRLLAETLRSNGVPATARHATPEGQSAGEAVLAAAAAFDADLIVKGAYTNSRLRQMIFGGMTQHLISAADRPVFFAH